MLCACTAAERKQLGRFLQGDAHRSPEETQRLYEFLQKELEESTAAPTPERAFTATFGKQPYAAAQLRYIMSYLSQAIERFFVWRSLQDRPADFDRLLLQAFDARGLSKAFFQRLRTAEKHLEQVGAADAETHRAAFELQALQFRHETRAGGRSSDTLLNHQLATLDVSYATNRLRLVCELHNRKNVLSHEGVLQDSAAFVRSLPPDLLSREPAMAAYCAVFYTLTQPTDETHFRTLKTLLRAEGQRMSNRDLRDLYVFAQNYCIKQVNSGNTAYLSELFDTYQALLTNDLLVEQGTLAQFHFKNIVTVALRLQRYNWASTFIDGYAQFLEADGRPNAVNFNRASLCFATGDYRTARRLLLEVTFTDVYYHLDAKALLLKTYYELDAVEPLHSLVSTFRTFLRRNQKISDYQRETYLNFVKFTLKLMRLKLGSRKPIAEIEAEMAGAKHIADLTWLRAKLAEQKM